MYLEFSAFNWVWRFDLLIIVKTWKYIQRIFKQVSNLCSFQCSKKTASLNRVDFELIFCDLSLPLNCRLQSAVDILVINPPYVNTDDPATSDLVSYVYSQSFLFWLLFFFWNKYGLNRRFVHNRNRYQTYYDNFYYAVGKSCLFLCLTSLRASQRGSWLFPDRNTLETL